MKKKQEGKKRLRGSKEAQERVRLLVADYLNKGKGSRQEAADLYGISLDGVQRIWRRYKTKGMPGLYNKKRGVQEGKKINGKQTDEIRRLIKDKLPDQLKLPFGLWTREAIKQLMRNRCGIELSRRQVGRYLKSWGYTPQKPISEVFEQKPEKVKEWLERDYPAIKKRATKENAVIYFGDETGMRSNPHSSPAGETPVIKKTGQGFSQNMISAISNRGHLRFMIIDGQFNSEVFQIFLQQKIKHSKQKIFFITDGHPVQKTKKLNEWLAQHTRRLEVFFSPPYSPELNPQVGNQDVKTNVIGKKRPINKEQTRKNVERFIID